MMNSHDKVQYAKMKQKADKLMCVLDRERLGRFAVPADLFAAVLGRNVTDAQAKGKRVSNSAVTSKFHNDFNMAISVNDFDIIVSSKDYEIRSQMWEEATAEVVFWNTVNKRVPALDLEHYSEEFKTAVDRLTLVYRHPELHDYFLVGIWDVDLATNFHENGIDAELARTAA